MGELDDRGYHAIAVGAADCANNGSVELQYVEWKPNEIGEMGIADTEVIHGDSDPEPLEATDGSFGSSQIAQQQPLRDLELQTLWRQLVGAKRRVNLINQPLVVELARGNVHGNSNVAGQLGAPTMCVRARCIENPSTYIHDVTGLLKDRYELAGGHDSESGVVPS